MKLTDIINEEKYTIIDPKGNPAGTGTKDQANQRQKKLGGSKKGYFVVPAKKALKARRTLEKYKFDFKSTKLQDLMSDLYFESVNEGVEPQIKKIAHFTGTRPEAVEDFVSKHSLNITKLLKYVQKGGLSQRMELVSALAGRDGNTIQKKVIKMFSESVNEAASKTYKIPTQRGTLHIEVEHDNAGVFVDVIFNRVDLTTTDIQFPTGEVEVTQRQKRVKLKESVNEGASTEEKRIVMMAIKKIAKYRNVPLHFAVNDVIRAAEELERTIGKK